MHKFGEVGVEEKGCLRCRNYMGYGFYVIEETTNGRVKYGLRVNCKVPECKPDLKPTTCAYCSGDLLKSLESVTDEDLKRDLLEMGMCANCYEEWRMECLCLICHFDYPSSSAIKGRKGNYCFCQGCEWNEKCPEKHEMFDDCKDMKEIPPKKVHEILEKV